MELNAQTWWAITTIASLAIGAIGYFLKRTMTKVDEHDKDISVIKQTYATSAEVDDHDKDINTIKQTYVTKNEFKELRQEIKADLDHISGDMSDMKEKSLSKQDFYRAHGETNESIKQLLNMLLKLNGGVRHDE